ncbi:MAG: polysaccharide biosynthesis protein [Lachnospiraceae bacterium]|nr:polysaccharide biosynthesis protein [Lachnospiraceae bacterium]
MRNRNSDSTFLVQGSVLAIASIVSRVIGLLYRIPMTNIIGEYGNDYYSCAYEIYSMLLLISSYSLPMAVSKIVSTRVTKHQKENANRAYLGALFIALITGTAGCIFVYFGAGFLTRVFQTPLSFLALRVLAPTLIIVAVLGTIRGFFQGLGSMVPSAISQIIEQIVNAVVSVGAAFVLFGYGTKVAAVIGGDQHYAEAYGAAGGTLGTSMGALAGLIFIAIIFVLYRRNFKKDIRREQRMGTGQVESYRSVMRVLILTILPILASTTLYNLVSIVDQGLFKNLAIAQGNPSDTVSLWWGVYSGYYRVLINVPIAISTAIATSAVPAIAAAFAKRDHDQVRHRIALAMRFIMIIAMPCAVGLAVLAKPIINLLYNTTSDSLAALLIQTGAISVIFYSISTLSNAILQGIDRLRIPIRNALISLAVNIASVPICLYVFHLNIYTMIVGNIVFSLVMCILNGLSVHKYSGYSPNIRKTYVLPAIASVLMGVIVFIVYFVLNRALGSNAIATIIAIIVGIIAYAVILLLIRGITEEELKSFPRGTAIIRITKKLHLLR